MNRWRISQRALGVLIVVLCIGCSPVERLPQVSNALPTPAQTLNSPTYVCGLTSAPPPDVPTNPVFVPTPAAPPEFAGSTERSQLVDTRFYSALLDREMPILVYLPPGYFDSQRRYPVLYMLGGWFGDYREWVWYGLCDAAEALIRGGHIQPLIIVMPEGDRSYWFNHAPVDGSEGEPWGDYIWKDGVDYVDANYRTLPQRESRAIGGLSAGGQAAFMLALTHPEIFSIAGGHSLSLRGADGSLPFFGDPEYFKQYDPIWLMENLNSWHHLTFWIDVGADDNQWGGPIRDFHALLDLHSVPHEWIDTWPGKHDNNYWSAHVGDYLVWYASKLIGQASISH